ncbi:MAG TPA: thioredoxin family protein [Candidatus Dormibacteraeota bacterium]|nr:thioredoxin family protein [Candidatus Dormibacteraeota bacterium]
MLTTPDGPPPPDGRATGAGAVHRVELQYFDTCPSWQGLEERLRVLAAGRGVELEIRRIADAEEARVAGFRGSPTILVDGRDPFGDDDMPVGLSCRLYATPDGPAGAPTTEQLRGALGW